MMRMWERPSTYLIVAVLSFLLGWVHVYFFAPERLELGCPWWIPLPPDRAFNSSQWKKGTRDRIASGFTRIKMVSDITTFGCKMVGMKQVQIDRLLSEPDFRRYGPLANSDYLTALKADDVSYVYQLENGLSLVIAFRNKEVLTREIVNNAIFF